MDIELVETQEEAYIKNDIEQTKSLGETISVNVDVNKEGVEDTITELKEAVDIRPNITIRNNQNVYVTINYFNKED